MNSEQIVYIYHNMEGVGGMHGHVVRLIPEDGAIMVGLHDRCCTPIEFLEFAREHQNKGLQVEHHKDLEKQPIYIFHPESAPWHIAVKYWIKAMEAAGEITING